MANLDVSVTCKNEPKGSVEPAGYRHRTSQIPVRHTWLLWTLWLSLLLLCLALVALAIAYFRCSTSNSSGQPDVVPLLIPEGNLSQSKKLRIISRREWMAQPARDVEFVKTPVPYVIVSHSVTEGCDTQAKCLPIVRYLQTFDVEGSGRSDIACNFLVGGDGYVYEGRGWDIVGAVALDWNNRSISISMIGTFRHVLPPKRQLLSLRQLIELGVSEGHIAKDYTLLAHQQVSATDRPGATLYKELQTWPHWSPTP